MAETPSRSQPGRRAADRLRLEEQDARVSSREALRFLTRAGRVLSSSLEPQRTFERLVRLAVPRVACFAALDLVLEDGRMERVAHGHIDADKEPLLERPEPFDPAGQGLLPIAEVARTGRPLMVERIERDWSGGAEVLERLRRIDGRSLMVVPLLVRDQVLGVLTLGSTRTDRHYQSKDLSLAQELARSAALALENARLFRQTQQAVAARDQVLAVVSHDLRNPVGRVQLAAELLEEGGRVSDDGRPAVGIILRAAQEMTRLIGDLLDVARIDAGTLSVDPAPVPLATLLERVDEAHRHAAERAGVQWQVERVEPDGVLLHVDEGRVLQALGNLIGNAMKFTPRGGTVRLELAEGDDAIRIGVRDSGPGMDAEAVAHAFDRFWQGRSGDSRGAGLGLAISHGIATAHGGRLWLESEPGAGTCAWLELPVAS